MAPKKKPTQLLWTPPGRFSYPFFASVDSGRQYSDDAYKTDLLIPKSIFKEKGKEIQAAVLSVGRDYFGTKFSLKSTNWYIPFKDTDTDEKIENEAMKNCIHIRAKSKPRKRGNQILPAIKPTFIGPRKGGDGKFPELTPEEIQNIKGGDWGVLSIAVFPYDQKGNSGTQGGVTFGLNAVQFWKEGEGFGQGRSKLLETAEELEAEIDTPDNSDVNNSPEEDDDSII